MCGKGQHHWYLYDSASCGEGDDSVGQWRQHRHDCQYERKRCEQGKPSAFLFPVVPRNLQQLPHNSLLTSLLCTGPHLLRLQRLESRRDPAWPQPRLRMGPTRHPRQHHLAGLHRHRHG